MYPLSAISCITVKEKLQKKGLVQKGDTKYMIVLICFFLCLETSKQNLKASSETDLKKQSKEKEKMSVSSSSITKEVNNNTTSQRKPASGPGIDLSTMRKEVQANTKEVSGQARSARSY